MSKYKYIDVRACYPIWFSATITLPSNWDDMSEDQRRNYVYESAGEEMVYCAQDGYYEYGKAIGRATVSDFEQWSVVSCSREDDIPLEDVITRPELQLVLDGTYEQKEHIEDDELFDEE